MIGTVAQQQTLSVDDNGMGSRACRAACMQYGHWSPYVVK